MPPSNPGQGSGKTESKLVRLLLALPFLALFYLSLHLIDIEPLLPIIKTIASTRRYIHGKFIFTLPTVSPFPALDATIRPFTALFFPSTFYLDALARTQCLTFLTDGGLAFALILLESTRRSNAWTPAALPDLFALLCQLRGFGVVAPLYLGLTWIFSPVEKFSRSADMRLTDRRWSATVLPVMAVVYYLPFAIMFLAEGRASLDVSYVANWIWQIFPVLGSALWFVLAYAVGPDTERDDRVRRPLADLPVLKVTVGSLVVLSAGVWVCTVLLGPWRLREIFDLSVRMRHGADLVELARALLVWDEIIGFGAVYLWLAYGFWDLKAAGMMEQSWLKLGFLAGASTILLGPGATAGLAWAWRERSLAYKRHVEADVSTGEPSGKEKI